MNLAYSSAHMGSPANRSSIIAMRAAGSGGARPPPRPVSVAAAVATSDGNAGDLAMCDSRAARSCRCRTTVGSSWGAVRSRAQTRHASALNLSAAVSTGSTQGNAATSGSPFCASATREQMARASGRKAGDRKSSQSAGRAGDWQPDRNGSDRRNPPFSGGTSLSVPL